MSKNKSKQIQEELALVKGDKAILNASDVVDWAQSHESSALHKCFEWDDSTAARQYRIWQARSLIALHIVTEKGERKMVSLSIDRTNGGGYREIDDVMREPGLRNILLQDALLELRRVKHRYNSVKELAKVWGEIDLADKSALEDAA
jgi:hypothetical protein